MNKKIIGIFITMLCIISVQPVIGSLQFSNNLNIKNQPSEKPIIDNPPTA